MYLKNVQLATSFINAALFVGNKQLQSYVIQAALFLQKRASSNRFSMRVAFFIKEYATPIII